MFNSDKMNKLMREVEDLMRYHSAATAEKNRILTQIGQATLAGEDAGLEMLRDKFNDSDFTVRWTEERLAEVKTEMSSLVDAIRF